MWVFWKNVQAGINGGGLRPDRSQTWRFIFELTLPKEKPTMNGEGGGLLTWWNFCAAHLRRAALLAGFFALALFPTQAARAQSGFYNNYNVPPYAQNDYSMTMEELPTTIALLNNDYGMMAPLNPA